MNNNNALGYGRHLGQRIGVLQTNIAQAAKARLSNDRGEGVISMAIAVLVIAALGVAMYAVFVQVGEAAGDKATESVNNIGS